MLPSELFLQRTGKEHLYNIMPIENVPSVASRGLLCYHRANSINHSSIAMNDVQARRDLKIVPGGLNLHDYANLYFDYRNPMLFKRKSQANELCILRFSSTVLNIENCIVSDRNAASPFARFYSSLLGISLLDFQKIYAKYWTHDDYYEQEDHKKIKCAEVLVPYCIPVHYLEAACVVGDQGKVTLEQAGFNQAIYVSKEAFFL